MGSFKRATRSQRKLRMALFGPSGSGKTYTALKLARELVGPEGTVALIDTERSSASIYAEFGFDTVPLTSYTHADYCALIEEAAAARGGGYDILVIDSVSHAWEAEGGVLDLVDEVASKMKGAKDSFRAWGDDRVKKAQRDLWDAVLGYPGHIIVTMRSKTAYERSVVNGKAKMEKLGLAPIQKSGIEFELDILGEMDLENTMTIIKARDPEGKLEGSSIRKPGAEFAAGLKGWLNKGTQPEEDEDKRHKRNTEKHEAAIKKIVTKLAKEQKVEYESMALEVWTWMKDHYGVGSLGEMEEHELEELPERICERFADDTPEERKQMDKETAQ